MKNNKKEKKLNKKEQTKILEKKCKELWSKIVRSYNNGICCWCNENKATNAHHWYINKSRSKRLQFNPFNGLPLCYGCHIHVIHKDASVRNSLKLLDIATEIFKTNGTKSLIKILEEANTNKEYTLDDLKKDFKELDTMWTLIDIGGYNVG